MHPTYRTRNWLNQRRFAQRKGVRQQIRIRDRHRDVLGHGSIRGDPNGPVVKTEVLMTCATRFAPPTGQGRFDRDPAPDGCKYPSRAVSPSNIASQSHDLTREFVTRHDRITRHRRVAGKNMQVGATNATCSHPNQQFVRAWGRVWHTAHSNVPRGINDYSSHNW